MTEKELLKKASNESALVAQITLFEDLTADEVNKALRHSRAAMCALQSLECFKRTGKFPEGS